MVKKVLNSKFRSFHFQFSVLYSNLHVSSLFFSLYILLPLYPSLSLPSLSYSLSPFSLLLYSIQFFFSLLIWIFLFAKFVLSLHFIIVKTRFLFDSSHMRLTQNSFITFFIILLPSLNRF